MCSFWNNSNGIRNLVCLSPFTMGSIGRGVTCVLYQCFLYDAPMGGVLGGTGPRALLCENSL